MAAVTPPALEQIQKMRESIKHCKNYRVVIDMGETVFDSTMSFFIWDDEHMILHAISANTDFQTQSIAPFRIDSIGYDQIESIYANID